MPAQQNGPTPPVYLSPRERKQYVQGLKLRHFNQKNNRENHQSRKLALSKKDEMNKPLGRIMKKKETEKIHISVSGMTKVKSLSLSY